MDYTLFFLNNLHDSMDLVNVELDSFFDLIQEDQEEYELAMLICIKHTIMNLSNCLELLIKYRLSHEHWSLIFSDINKAKYSDKQSGNFSSVDIKTGITRLKNICEIDYPFEASNKIHQYRNKLMHYTLVEDYKTLLVELANSMLEIREFSRKEVIKIIPQEAKTDFRDSLRAYKKNAEKLLGLSSSY